MEVKSSDSSHLHSLDSNTDSDDKISDPHYFEFYDSIDMKRMVKLSVGMRFSIAA